MKEDQSPINKTELEFFLKVIRNGLILGGLYFVSVWASLDQITFNACKPAILFLFTYILTELANRYGIVFKGQIPPQPIRSKKGQSRIIPTLIL